MPTNSSFRHSATLIFIKTCGFTSTVSGPAGCFCQTPGRQNSRTSSRAMSRSFSRGQSRSMSRSLSRSQSRGMSRSMSRSMSKVGRSSSRALSVFSTGGSTCGEDGWICLIAVFKGIRQMNQRYQGDIPMKLASPFHPILLVLNKEPNQKETVVVFIFSVLS